MARPKVGKMYKHFKGSTYLVLGFAEHSEDSEELVLYQKTGSGEKTKVWARPVYKWNEKLADGGNRFEEV